jgi:cytochrome c biogenesis protein CcdA/thiol-disulfide isomerase/thioredoxin
VAVAAGIAFVVGVLTALSPCAFPVLPIIFAGGASGSRRRPAAIIAGVVAGFTGSLLVVSWVLRRLHLPQDLLRNVSIALLFVFAATLIVPRLGVVFERPLGRLTRRPAGDLGGGFLLGLALGLVFVPCGGLVLASVAAGTATLGTGDRVLVTFAYALGVALPMLGIAYGGRWAANGAAAFRAHAGGVRAALGVVIAVTALLITFHVDRSLANVGSWGVADRIEKSCTAQRHLTGECRQESSSLADLGTAPDFTAISSWLNSKPLSLRKLHGKVVLVDFWTYSCINCLRTLPHLKAWWRDYHRRGLVIVGVHTPEFAFEGKTSNVRAAVKQLGVAWPVALDARYGTWKAYGNQYWPAEYLIDRSGHVRTVHFGEGEYNRTERVIRQLLGEPGQPRAELADMTPTELITPETYLGLDRVDDRYVGLPPAANAARDYGAVRPPPQNDWAYGGEWRVGHERAVSGKRAALALHFHASKVYLVMGGRGSVRVTVGGRPLRTIPVRGISRLYTIVDTPHLRDAQLRLGFSPGVSVYSFTFG